MTGDWYDVADCLPQLASPKPTPDDEIKILQCVLVGANDGLCAVQINASDMESDLHLLLHDKYVAAAQSEPLALRLYHTKTTIDGVDHWLGSSPELLKTLSWGILPPGVQICSASHLIEGDASVGDTFDEATVADGDAVIHVLVVPSDKVISHGVREKRWSAINEIIQKYGAWRDDPPPNEQMDGRDTCDALRDTLSSILWSSTSRYEEPVIAPPRDEFHVLSTMLTWGGRVNVRLTSAESMWTHLVTPIVWCVAHQFPGQRVLHDIELCGRHNIVARHVPIRFQLRNGHKRVVLVEVKRRQYNEADVQALLACELLAEREDCRWVGAVVTDGVQWTFLRSLSDRVLFDRVCYLRFEKDQSPTAETLGEIVGKMIHMLT